MVILLISVLFLIPLFIVSEYMAYKEINDIMEESEKSFERVQIRTKELLNKERKYDAIKKHNKYKLPKWAYGRD